MRPIFSVQSDVDIKQIIGIKTREMRYADRF